MKKKFIYFLIIPVVLLSSCNRKKENVKQDKPVETGIQVLSERIEYDVLIDNEKSMDPWMNHVEEKNRMEFIALLFNQLKDGHACNQDGQTVSTDDVLAFIHEKYPAVGTTMSNPADIITNKTINIRKLRFREKWTYDNATFQFQKSVLAVGPVLEYQDGDLNRPVVLFWVNCDTAATSKSLTPITGNIISDAIVNNQLDQIKGYDSLPADYFSNLSELAKTAFFNDIIAAVSNNKVKAYDFYFHPLKEKPASDLTSNLLGKIKFAEAWDYLPSTPLVFKKTVFAINPSITVLDEEYGGIQGYKPIFWVVTDSSYQKSMEGKGEMGLQ